MGKAIEWRGPETIRFGVKTVAVQFLLYAGRTVGAAHILLFGCGAVLLTVVVFLL